MGGSVRVGAHIPLWPLGGYANHYAQPPNSLMAPTSVYPLACFYLPPRATTPIWYASGEYPPVVCRLEAVGILTHTFFVKFAGPPRRLLGARRRCPRPGRGPKHTARKQHPASPPTGRAVGSGQNPLPGGCVLISPDLYVCLCSSTTKKRVSSYSGSIDSSRRVLLAPCLAA